jgi:hypothetical protein
MEKVLHELQWQSVLIYLEDIAIFSETIPQHLEQLEEVLSCLRGACLKLKFHKCELFKLLCFDLPRQDQSSP